MDGSARPESPIAILFATPPSQTLDSRVGTTGSRVRSKKKHSPSTSLQSIPSSITLSTIPTSICPKLIFYGMISFGSKMGGIPLLKFSELMASNQNNRRTSETLLRTELSTRVFLILGATTDGDHLLVELLRDVIRSGMHIMLAIPVFPFSLQIAI